MADVQELAYELLTPIAELISLPLIHAYQNDGRIAKPYATIRIDTFQYPQHEHTFTVQETGYQTVGGWRKAIVEVQVFGRNAGHIVRRLMLALATNTSVMKQVELNVSIGNRLLLTEIPELLNLSQYEPRGIHQFEMFYSDQIEEEVGIIEEVEIGYVEPPTEWDKDKTEWDDHCTETSWDDNNTDWDNATTNWDEECYEETVWDGEKWCVSTIRAFPPYTPEHPEPYGDK
jgi:hypothetical protein